MASPSTLASPSLDRDHGADVDLDLEPLTGSSGNAHDQHMQKQKNAKRQRKNVLIVNFLAVLLTLGIFSILLEYTAIADRTRAHTAAMHRPSHLTSDGGDENAKNGGATHLYASVVDVYDEDEESMGEGTPLPSFAYQQNLPLEELLQLNQLFDACMTQNNTLIDSAAPSSSFPFTLSETAPAELLLKTLRVCPDVDVFVPTAARGDNEYCQDAVVYTKFLQSRMLPRWVLDVELRDEAANATVTYFDLCPRTPMLFLNHHWDALPSHPKWPNHTKASNKKKPVYLMPNIDSIELQREHLLAADVVLCKTKVCFSRVSAWYAQEAQRGTTVATKVLYTRHTSPNPSAPLQVNGVAILQKDYANPSFVHFAGDLRGTKQVLECWLSHPELPQLTVLMGDAAFKESSAFDARLHSSGNVIVDTQGPSQWSQRMAEASFLVAPSESESFGHAINQARATGGVVITTDVAPMNELIPSDSGAGVLVRAKRRVNPKQLLGSGFTGGPEGLQGGKGLVAELSAKSVCDAVDALLRKTQEQTRQALGVRAHRQYYADMAVFAAAMVELRAHARESDESNAAALASSQSPATRAPEGVQRLGNLRVDTAAFSIPPPAASS